MDLAKTLRKSSGTLDETENNEWTGWKDRNPLDRKPFTISPIVKEVMSVFFRNY